MYNRGMNTPICKCDKCRQCEYPAPNVVTVDSVANMQSLSNCFVNVTSIRTVFFISPQHEITVISSLPVFVDDYDVVTNPLGVRGQVLYDFANNKAYVYNEAGEYRIINLMEEQ